MLLVEVVSFSTGSTKSPFESVVLSRGVPLEEGSGGTVVATPRISDIVAGDFESMFRTLCLTKVDS